MDALRDALNPNFAAEMQFFDGPDIVVNAARPSKPKPAVGTKVLLPQKKEETRSERLARIERERTETSAYCGNLQYETAKRGLFLGTSGSGATGGAEAYRRYGALRAFIRGAGRAVSRLPGIIVSVGLAVFDFNSGADGDPRYQ